MAHVQLDGVVRHLRGLRDTQALSEASDAQLLARFTAAHEEGAFTALLQRHGSMVLSVSRRVLGNAADAEDVFQAAFLLLAQKANSIRKAESVASWLYGVTQRLALKAKMQGVRRQAREKRAADLRDQRTGGEAAGPDVLTALDTALAELPERYRSALVLCYLEGLSHADAARQLGCPLATLRTRVSRGRKLLRDRLARHGLALSTAGLFTLLLASAAPAAAPAALVRTTLKAALSLAAGQPASALCSARVAGLVRGGLPTVFLTKTKIATVMLLLAGLLAGAGALATFRAAPAQSGEPPAAGKARPRAAGKENDKDAIAFAGRVLDPDGKPVAGVKLHVFYYSAKALPMPVRAVSDAEGRFRFTIARADFDGAHTPIPWEQATVIAVAAGYGPALSDNRPGKSSRTDLTLRLVKDVPLTGRVLDLQGKPLAGVTLRVHGLRTPGKGDLTAFLNAVKESKELYPAMQKHLFGFERGWIGLDVGTFSPAMTTTKDGRFEIRGLGRERLVSLRIEGPTIATRDFFALTRPADALQVPGYRRYLPNTAILTIHGNGFGYVAAPCKPIIGVVRDRDTGKPIPGAVVTSFKRAGSPTHGVTDLQTVADRDGRYRLLGMPKGEGNIIRAGPSESEPYLMATREVADTPGLEPVTVDFALKRGVWLTGRVLDKVTRRPIHAQVEYVVFADNPHRGEAPGLSVDIFLQTRPADGTFRTVALPGRGLLAARAWNDQYRLAVGADAIKGLEPRGYFHTYPHLLFAQAFHSLKEINPAREARQVTCDFLLDPGRTVRGEVRGPDGKPLAGVRVSGLRTYNGHGLWENEPLKTSAFTVTGLASGEQRLLEFVHAEKKLAGSLVVKGDEKGPLTVKLVACGTLVGRLVTPDGQPVTDGNLASLRGPIGEPDRMKADPTVGSLPGILAPDRQGKFRLTGLVPGLTYHLGFSKGNYLHRLGGAAAGKLTLKPGETKDLGDVVVKPIE